jgi:FkbM family methyltransferase
MDDRVKHFARRVATRVGVSPELQRRAYGLVIPDVKRDRRDNEHLRMLLAFSLSPDSNCIDVGAHQGEILREMVRLAPAGRHIAFEPLPDFHAELVREFPGVDVRCSALSSEEGEATFTYVRSNPRYSGFRERDYPAGREAIEKIVVKRERLDALLPDDYVPRLIKIDVEGAEYEVLKGGIETIQRHRPIIYFEHGLGSTNHYGTGPVEVHRLLTREAGLRIFDVDGGGPYSESAFEDVFSKPIWNFVARA